jgi:hypothetical protein
VKKHAACKKKRKIANCGFQVRTQNRLR